jgi:hypothetical protein
VVEVEFFFLPEHMKVLKGRLRKTLSFSPKSWSLRVYIRIWEISRPNGKSSTSDEMVCAHFCFGVALM